MIKPIVLFIELKIAAKNKYICDITEKLFNNNISVSIFANDPKSINQLNDLLWTWKQDSFIPHSLLSSENKNNPDPVVLTSSAELFAQNQALILCDPLPLTALEKYKLIFDFAEVYHSDKKLESRKRFKEMRDSGIFDLHFTQLGAILAKKTITLEPSE